MDTRFIIIIVFAVLSAVICLGVVIWVIYQLHRPTLREPTGVLEPPPVPIAPEPLAPASSPPPPPPVRDLWVESEPPTDPEYGFLEQDLDRDLGLVYGTDCAVCSDIMDGRSTVTRIKKCNHAFHKDCIGQWYHAQSSSGQSTSCPICREPVTKQHIFIKIQDLAQLPIT